MFLFLGILDVGPHPFRCGNTMMSVYPSWLGTGERQRPGALHLLQQAEQDAGAGVGPAVVFRRDAGQNGTDEELCGKFGDVGALLLQQDGGKNKRGKERGKVLASSLLFHDCRYPSNHLPVGAIFDWRWDECEDPHPPGNDAEEAGDAGIHCARGVEVRGMNVMGSEGSNLQDDMLQDQLNWEKRRN